MKNNDFKCPFCGTSDFKVENGYYVCQICGNETPIEDENEPKGKETQKGVNPYDNYGNSKSQEEENQKDLQIKVKGNKE